MPGRVLFNQQLKRHLQVPSFIVLLLGLCVKFLFLPPANEVWGKVMFLQVSVCPQLDLCMMSLPVWLTGLMFLPGASVRGSVRETSPPPPGQRLPCTVTSGWYTSYWNALLFFSFFKFT